ncbi:MAG: hypothetical protein ACYTBJ_12330 [Planctomycetota bacterium]|jgi:hypothetical protein
MKWKLTDVVVLIAVAVLLMGILVPALNASRQTAIRLVCQANLTAIGRAMKAWANDNEGCYPRAGGPDIVWGTLGRLYDFDAETEAIAFTDGKATVSSSMFLLIKYGMLTPKHVVCKGDAGAIAYKLAYTKRTWVSDIRLVWDFGDGGAHLRIWPGGFCSYAYHMPYVDDQGFSYVIKDILNPGSPVCADRNPHLDRNAVDPQVGDNSVAHLGKGQNVLYQDGSVSFEKNPKVGIEGDNIYTYASDPNTGGSDRDGTPPAGNGDGTPAGLKDAFLVMDRNYL